MARQYKKKRMIYTVWAFVGLILTCALVGAEETVRMSQQGAGTRAVPETLRLSQNNPGDSEPIILHADEISTWIEGSERVILLKGAVLVENGVIHCRMKNGVAWVDPSHTQATGILHLELYGEGEVRLENGPRNQNGEKAFVDLNTRGALKFLSQQKKILQQNHAEDIVFKRGQAVRNTLAVPPSAPVLQRTSVEEPAAGPSNVAPIPTERPVQETPTGQGPMPGTTPPPIPGPPTTPRDFGPMTPPSAIPSSSPGSAPGWPVQGTPPAPGPIPDVAPPSNPAGGIPPSASGPLTPPVGPPVAGPIGAPLLPGNPPPGSAPGPPDSRPPVPERQVRIVPRTSSRFQEQTVPLANGEQAIVVTGGVILTVRNPSEGVGILDIEADRLVVWTRGNNFQEMFRNLRGEGQRTRELEFYLAGNVEIREQNGPETRKISADEVYYDAGRNVAIAYQADLEFKQAGLPDPIHLKTDRLEEISPTLFRAERARVYSSHLPSDPGLEVDTSDATIEEKKIPRRNFLGIQFVNRTTGEPETENQRFFRGKNVLLRLEKLPVFYLPILQGDVNDPLGPLETVRLNYNRIYGADIGVSLNMYNLFAVDPIPGTRWSSDLDYLTNRGPSIGTTFDYAGKDLFGIPGKYTGVFEAVGMEDRGQDILGNGRGSIESHPDDRGRILWRQRWELPEDFTLLTQVAAISDKNYLEQYYKNEFDLDLNQETYAYLKQQRDNWAWTFLAEPNIRNWVTETEWLPRADGYLIGQTFDIPFLDRLTYSVHGSAGFGKLEPTREPPPPTLQEPTELAVSSGRFDLWQEVSLPFYLGPVKLAPYAISDLTYYTEDLAGNDRGRSYEGAGLRASMPFTRLFPDVQSELLNLNGINHKIVLSANYYAAHSDTPVGALPQLDLLNDDATDQALRDIQFYQPFFNPKHGFFLVNSPLFNPQLYAIRRLADDAAFLTTDTADSIQVLQMDLRQRWQTKRGYPGNQHIVDWMTLDLSGSYFPDSTRDNFGEPFAFLQYDWIWNIGDRTSLVSTGWLDPISNGARVFTIGASFNRPDRTNFSFGFRDTYPLNSELVWGSVTYVFSPKYAGTVSIGYDLTAKPSVIGGTAMLTRMGTDLQLGLGVTYSSQLNTVGVAFEITPNLLPATSRAPGVSTLGQGLLGH